MDEIGGHRRRVTNRLQNAVAFVGRGTRWEMLPRAVAAIAVRWLDVYERDAIALVKRERAQREPLLTRGPLPSN